MKKILFYLTVVVSSLLFSCNEELEIASTDELIPSISEFSPATGSVGTQIVIIGENLQKIVKAYINDQEVKINSLISGTYMTIEATSKASTGVIRLETSSKTVTTTSVFTYTYPTPSLGNLPTEALEAGAAVSINGENLDVVTKLLLVETVSVGEESMSHEVEIVYQKSTELVFVVPIIPAGTFKLQMNYAQADGDKFTQSSDVNLVNDGVIVIEPLNETYAVGDKIMVTGAGFATVTEILIGDVKQKIESFDAANLTFEVVDDPKLADGTHITTLTFVAGEVHKVINERFKVEMPTFYKWAQKQTGARSTGSHLLCIETGTSHNIKTGDFAIIDPMATSKSGGVCVGSNQLDGSVTNEEYYGVKPYIFMLYYGSGLYLYGPSQRNDRISQFNSALGKVYGTPNVQFRTLDVTNAEEKALFDKITGGTLTNADFTSELIDTFALTGAGSDGWSNATSGGINAYLDPNGVKTAARPWGGSELKGAKDVVNYDPNTVVMIFHMEPNKNVWVESEVNKTMVRKFGFLDITNSNQEGHNSVLTFDVYWQRTPMIK